MKSLTSARGFTTRAVAVSWRLFESGAVPQSTHLLTHTQAIAYLFLPDYASAGDWGKGGPPLPWQVGQSSPENANILPLHVGQTSSNRPVARTRCARSVSR